MHPTATAAMAEEKGKVAMVGITEPYYVDRPGAAGGSGKAKSRHVLMAVTSIVVVAMLVAGIIGAAYVFKSAIKDIEKYHMTLDEHGDKPSSEDVESDVTDNIVTYHLMTSLGEQWVLNDFSKGITLYKTIEDGNTACYVTPLNHSEATPEKVRANMKESSESDVDGSDGVVSRIIEDPIENPDFLGDRINSMCDGVSIYWITPTCGGNGDGLTAQPYPTDVDTPSRQKRETVDIYCIQCGCMLLCAPYVRGSYYYDDGWRCRLQFAGTPWYLWLLPKPCNRPLALVNAALVFPDTTTPGVPTTPAAARIADENESTEMSATTVMLP